MSYWMIKHEVCQWYLNPGRPESSNSPNSPQWWSRDTALRFDSAAAARTFLTETIAKYPSDSGYSEGIVVCVLSRAAAKQRAEKRAVAAERKRILEALRVAAQADNRLLLFAPDIGRLSVRPSPSSTPRRRTSACLRPSWTRRGSMRIFRGIWIDPRNGLPKKLPEPSSVRTGLRVTRFVGARKTLEGAHVEKVEKVDGKWVTTKDQEGHHGHTKLFLSCGSSKRLYEYQHEDIPDLWKRSTVFELEPRGGRLELQLATYFVKRKRTPMRCAGRCAGGEAPDWLWFRSTKSKSSVSEPDGSFVVVGKHGIVVGNIHEKHVARVLTPKQALVWARSLTR